MEALLGKLFLQLRKDVVRDIVKEIKLVLVPKTYNRKWIKSFEVMEMLNLSKGKLQTLRKNGTLRYTRINRLIYYDMDDIQNLLEKNRRG